MMATVATRSSVEPVDHDHPLPLPATRSRRKLGKNPAMTLIQFKGVTKSFGEKVVYHDLSLEIRSGEAFTIIGGSGQGKSVMLKMLIGLLSVDAGTIHYAGDPVHDADEKTLLSLRRRIAMLFQGSALFDSMIVKENVAYGLREHYRLSDDEIDTRVAEALEAVGMAGAEHQWPSDLSGGMKKRVALARALVLRPEVLLYDEPTTGLDPMNINRIVRLINDLKTRFEVTSIVVTHDMNTAFRVSDRMAMIHGGQIIFCGTPEEVRATRVPQVFDFIRGRVPDDGRGASTLESRDPDGLGADAS